MEPDLHKRHYFTINRTKTNTQLYAEDPDTIADSDDNLQKGVLTFQNIAKQNCGMEKSQKNPKRWHFYDKTPVRCKIVVDNKCLQVKHFKRLGSEISYENVQDVQQQQKINKIF